MTQRMLSLLLVMLIAGASETPAAARPALTGAATPANGTVEATTDPGAIPSATGIPGAQAAALQPAYGQLPLLFIENGGQTDPQVAFTLLGGPSTVFFTPTGVTYALVEPSPTADRLAPDGRTPGSPDAAVAAARPRPRAAAPLGRQARLPRRQPGCPALLARTLPRRSSPTSAAGPTNGTRGCAPSSASSIPICGRALIWPTPARAAPAQPAP